MDSEPAEGQLSSIFSEGEPSLGEARLRLISFDIDGTLETGEPPGKITLEMVREAKARGWLIGSCSDRPASAQRLMWEKCAIEVDFAVVKNHLEVVRSQFQADSYLHIGDTEVDRWYAEHSGFEFLHVAEAENLEWLA